MNDKFLKGVCDDSNLRITVIQFLSTNYKNKNKNDPKKLQEILEQVKLIPNGDKIWTRIQDKQNGEISDIRKKIAQRDLKIIFIDETFNKFKIDELLFGDITSKEYSPPAIWAILQDIPNFLKTVKVFKDDKQESFNFDDVPLNLYDLYTTYRINNTKFNLEDDISEEIKRVLLELLKILKNKNVLTVEEELQKPEGDEELKVLEPALSMKQELIHIIREYLRLKHGVKYTYDDVIGDIDTTSNPDAKLQIINDLTSEYTFPGDVLDTLDHNNTKKEVSEIKIQILNFGKKKKALEDDDVPAMKNRLGGEPDDNGDIELPEGELGIPQFDEIKANIINIVSLVGKIELKENKPELGDSYLIDVISPIINRIGEIKSRTTLVAYLATLQPLVGYPNTKDKDINTIKIKELFKDKLSTIGVDMDKFVVFLIKKQVYIRKVIYEKLKQKIASSFQIGNGLLKVLSHIQDDKAFTKAIFDAKKGGKQTEKETLTIITDLCLVESLLDDHFKNNKNSKYQGFKNALTTQQNFKATCEAYNKRLE